jgi:hypothetical protein
MRKQIYDIVFAAQYEGLSTKEATDKLLFLIFGKSEKGEHPRCQCKVSQFTRTLDEEGEPLCGKCGRRI